MGTMDEQYSGAWLDVLHQEVENQQPITSGHILRLLRMIEAEHGRLTARDAEVARLKEAVPVRYELVKENNSDADWDEGDFSPPYREWWMIYRYETVTKEQRDFGTMYFTEDDARTALAALAEPSPSNIPEG